MAETQSDLARYQSDHDVLIELRTEMRGVRADISDLKTNVAGRVTSLEEDRITKQEAEDIHTDIENLKLWRSMLIGAWSVCTVILIPIAFAYFG